jgi:hypothetical protein
VPLKRLLHGRLNQGHLLLVWIVVFTCLVFFGMYTNRKLGQQGRQAREGLCALKHDVELRVDGAREFLKGNPNGVPGIPASVIRTSLKNQEATLRALHRLHCNQEGAR